MCISLMPKGKIKLEIFFFSLCVSSFNIGVNVLKLSVNAGDFDLVRVAQY